MKSIYDGMLKAFKRGLKSAIENEGRVFVTVKTELPVEEKTPLTCQFRKINQNVRLPERNGAAYDLFLPEDITISPGETVKIDLGFACKLPPGYFAVIAMRSSTWARWGFLQTNGIGIIDKDYCGNEDRWKASVWFPKENAVADAIYPITIPAGTRIAQFILMPIFPDLNFEIVDNLPDPSRGGFGSTGL